MTMDQKMPQQARLESTGCEMAPPGSATQAQDAQRIWMPGGAQELQQVRKQGLAL